MDAKNEQDRAYSLGLSQSLLSCTTLTRLLQAFGSARAIWTAEPAELRAHLKSEQLDQLLAARNRYNPEELLQKYTQQGIQILLVTDEDYPPLLKQTHDPPFILYVKGNPAIFRQKCLAVVGTRSYTYYGQNAVDQLIEGLAPYQPCIVSGLAAGIDTLAHQAALRNKLTTVAVFGTGIDKTFPIENGPLADYIVQSGSACISEYPIGVHGEKWTFPARNRIIAGMSLGTLVIEGGRKSGALITARCALDENRTVMAVPGSIMSPVSNGPNRLIQQGAIPVQTGEDIAAALNWSKPQVIKAFGTENPQESVAVQQVIKTLSELEKSVLNAISYEPMPIEAIHNAQSTLTIMDLNSTLTLLELRGLIQPHAGSRYARV